MAEVQYRTDCTTDKTSELFSEIRDCLYAAGTNIHRTMLGQAQKTSISEGTALHESGSLLEKDKAVRDIMTWVWNIKCNVSAVQGWSKEGEHPCLGTATKSSVVRWAECINWMYNKSSTEEVFNYASMLQGYRFGILKFLTGRTCCIFQILSDFSSHLWKLEI